MQRLFIYAGLLLLTACTAHPPIHTMNNIDLDRFMGDWYVIANIPTWIEKDAFNAVESYQQNADASIATTFSFRQGGFDGALKTYNPVGFVSAENNAVWGMQFIWPIQAEYRILYLNDDYSQTVIGRSARDYLWIMAKTPNISDEDYHQLLKFVGEQGYDVSKILKVPQRWESTQ